MKTNTPQVTIRLDSTKQKKDGTAPVYLHVSWRGRAKMATGIYCKPTDFSEKSLVKGNVTANKKLRALLGQVEDNISKLAENSNFTAKDCITFGQVKKAEVTAEQVIVMLARDRGSEISTMKHYQCSLSAVKKVTSTPYFSIDANQWQGIAKQWKNNGIGLSTIHGRLSKCKSLYTYAVQHGICDNNPFDEWSFKKSGYIYQPNQRALDDMEVMAMENWVKKTDNIGGIFWLASYYFCGVALCDMVNIEWANDFHTVVNGGNAYIVGGVNRKKTNREARLVCNIGRYQKDMFNFKMYIYSKMCTIDFKSKTTSRWNQLINEELKKAPVDGVTFYSARHTFATKLVNSNIPLNDIATLMGRSISNLQVYIKQLATDDHLTEVMKGI